ncbi:aminotransferase class I/II-fold pyridoxal phosphate-dependent enzyme [Acetilactobacillus jinshanensis]|nr:aminotransferase class I/II-fold pyridoxal phosphate-dependent enzyme [Acetilactobacillus jinshanensis]
MDLSKDMNNIVMAPWTGLYSFNFKIAKIPDLINLMLGEPGFNTPMHVKEAAVKSIWDNHSHYTDPRGLLSLRTNASQYLKRKYHLNYDPKTQMIVTTGVSEGLNSTLTAILNPGDEVIVPTPGYPFYIPNILLHGAKPIYIDTSKDGFYIKPDRLNQILKSHPKVKALILNYPDNPTGITYDQEQLEDLAEVIQRYHVFCLCDEIYSELTYDHPHYSMGNLLPEQSIVFNGVSKAFAMTGWRIGIVCGPAKVINGINKVHSITVTAPNTFAQYAASEAFKNGYKDDVKTRDAYRVHRDILKHGLESLGFDCANPQGAFYMFPKIPAKYGANSMKFALSLARNARVGVVPGSIFGPDGEGHVRITFAASLEKINEALKRIKLYVQSH